MFSGDELVGDDPNGYEPEIEQAPYWICDSCGRQLTRAELGNEICADCADSPL